MTWTHNMHISPVKLNPWHYLGELTQVFTFQARLFFTQVWFTVQTTLVILAWLRGGQHHRGGVGVIRGPVLLQCKVKCQRSGYWWGSYCGSGAMKVTKKPCRHPGFCVGVGHCSARGFIVTLIRLKNVEHSWKKGVHSWKTLAGYIGPHTSSVYECSEWEEDGLWEFKVDYSGKLQGRNIGRWIAAA